MKKRTTLILLILTFAIYTSNINVQITAEENNYRPTSLELTPHDSIYITSDSGFEVFPGTGTVEDPHTIEGYSITTMSNRGISITNTTEYFVIRNCYVDAYIYGIYIDDVADGTATVINNTCTNNDKGIYLSYSGSSTVINNMFNNNDGIGIWLWFSGSSTVANNTFTNCGLLISEGTVDAELSYTVENNWVNGKELGFYTNLNSTTIADPVYGQLILINCTNVTVRDQILNYTTIGLILKFCTSSVIINNTCSNNNYWGIYLSSSGSSTVINNTCSNNNIDGIKLWRSGSSTITNNTCSNNNIDGIRLRSSDFCVVTYNILQENDIYGIDLVSSSDNTLIHHNNFIDNNLGGTIYGTSQARDDCENNTWYDTETLEGNYWSDWSKTGSYAIYGSAGSNDLYPLDEPVEHSTDETQIYFTFALLISVVPLILTRIISKKAKKKQKNSQKMHRKEV